MAAIYLKSPHRRARVLPALLLPAALLASCAGTTTNEESPASEYDPWESTNRKVYNFNVAVDKATLKPIAKGYKAVMPNFARRGVTNFFDNLTTPRSSLNNFLQGKPTRGFKELGRFLVNSTMGIGGLINITDIDGWARYDETFGQTFAVWGLPEGPYLMLPFLGPHSVLDAGALPFDYYTELLRPYENTSVRDKLRVLKIIDMRYRLLAADKFLDDSEDPYIALREAYLQNRAYKIHDGDPPVEDDYYEFFEDEESFDDE